MARLATSETVSALLKARFDFLRLFLDQEPSLDEEDQRAVSPEASRLGFADTQWQVIELALALDDLPTAQGMLRTLVYDEQLAVASPLRWIGAACAMGVEVGRDTWRQACLAARSEPLIELLWAARFSSQDLRFPLGMPETARCARIRRLQPLLREGPYEDRAHAYVLLLAMCSDYAVRLEVQFGRKMTLPQSWSLIDWPLLLFQLARLRSGQDQIDDDILLVPHPAPALVSDVQNFLRRTAIDLDQRTNLNAI